MTPPDQPRPDSFRAFYILPGERVSTYVIRKAIGHGGGQMAYLAEASDGRRVVLKMSLFPMDRERSENRKMHERFLRQVGCLLNLRGTLGVADIFGHDMFPDHSESGHAYLVQEWIPGSINLLDWYRNKPHKLKTILGGFITLANACSEMMRRGICHRDLKPENILVTPDGLPKIVDFDSARVLGAAPLTTQAPGAWPGTKLYYSPEVCRAILSDWTTVYKIPFEDLFIGDLHALGVIFYQVLAGKHPFNEYASPLELFEQIAYDTPERPRALNPQVPFGLDKVTMKLLQKNSEQRYTFGDEVVADLEALLETDEDWEQPFQTPAGDRRPSRTPTNRTRPGTPPLTPTPMMVEGSAALDLTTTAIVLAPPRQLGVRGPRALLRLEPAPSAHAPHPLPAEAPSVEPAPRLAPRRHLALLLAVVIALALMLPWALLGQHAVPGSIGEKGMMLAGQVKTAVVAVTSMVLTSCAGLFGKVRTGEEWLAKCPPASRKVVTELNFDPNIGVGEALPGPNVIVPEDEVGLEVRDGPVEARVAITGFSNLIMTKLYGVIQTDSQGAHIHFDKMQLFSGSEPDGAPPAGRIVDICAFASVQDYSDDLIPKAVDPPPPSELHPGFMFVMSNNLGIHFAH